MTQSLSASDASEKKSASGATSAPARFDELIITSKGEAPRFQMLDKTLLMMGRELINDIPLVSTAVSRHHARIEKRDGQWFVTDLGSTNGTYLAKERLAGNVEYQWMSGHPLQLGPFTLQWQSPRDLTSGQTLVLMPDELKQLDEVAEDVQQDDTLNAILDKKQFELALGESAEIKIGILSQSQLDKQLEVIVAGIPEHWVELPPSAITIVPKKHRSISIKVDVPQSMMVEAGTYDFEVLLRDLYNKAQVTRLPGKITVPAKRDMSLRLVQSGEQNGSQLKLTLRNLGNVASTYKLTAQSEALKVDGKQWSTALGLGQSIDLEYRVSAEVRPLFGKPQPYPFTLNAKDEAGNNKQVDGKVILTPTVPSWMLIAILIAFTIMTILLTLILR